MSIKTILIAEDEEAVRELLVDSLSLAGYKVLAVEDGLEALHLTQKHTIDLILTDVNMPKRNGYEFVKALRDRGDDTPVIFLTARNQKPDISLGFKLGADDYVAKPFGLEELTLRISAILKRYSRSFETNYLTCGPLSLDVETHQVTINGNNVDLSPTEFRLLTYLLENKNIVLTKHSLLDTVWDLGFADSTAVVDTFISYLRKKFRQHGFDGIVTVRGIGFKISDSK